mmetsp:Transcript_6265/g.23550  ORF Transcript_6265/g.23550 Transcript_6265/m.23550 type:complete len:229 (-) Transcript_6265:1696-2382(-)
MHLHEVYHEHLSRTKNKMEVCFIMAPTTSRIRIVFENVRDAPGLKQHNAHLSSSFTRVSLTMKYPLCTPCAPDLAASLLQCLSVSLLNRLLPQYIGNAQVLLACEYGPHCCQSWKEAHKQCSLQLLQFHRREFLQLLVPRFSDEQFPPLHPQWKQTPHWSCLRKFCGSQYGGPMSQWELDPRQEQKSQHGDCPWRRSTKKVRHQYDTGCASVLCLPFPKLIPDSPPPL